MKTIVNNTKITGLSKPQHRPFHILTYIYSYSDIGTRFWLMLHLSAGTFPLQYEIKQFSQPWDYNNNCLHQSNFVKTSFVIQMMKIICFKKKKKVHFKATQLFEENSPFPQSTIRFFFSYNFKAFNEIFFSFFSCGSLFLLLRVS